MASVQITGLDELKSRLDGIAERSRNLSVPFQRARAIVLASIQKQTGVAGRVVREQGSDQSYSLDVATVTKAVDGRTVTQAVRAHSRTITQVYGRPISARAVAVRAHTRNVKQRVPAWTMHADDRRAIVQAMYTHIMAG